MQGFQQENKTKHTKEEHFSVIMSSHTPINNKPGGKINTQDLHEDYTAFSPCSQTEYNKKKSEIIYETKWLE